MELTTDNGYLRGRDILVVTGDAECLGGDLSSLPLPKDEYDIFSCNRSIYSGLFGWPVHHWGAADGEEAIAMAKGICVLEAKFKHTLAPDIPGFNVFWTPKNGSNPEDWRGTTAVMAIMAGLAMGYKDIILAGCPMDNSGHWYDANKIPRWTHKSLIAYKKIKAMGLPVYSMSGNTRTILGGYLSGA